MKIAII